MDWGGTDWLVFVCICIGVTFFLGDRWFAVCVQSGPPNCITVRIQVRRRRWSWWWWSRTRARRWRWRWGFARFSDVVRECCVADEELGALARIPARSGVDCSGTPDTVIALPCEGPFPVNVEPRTLSVALLGHSSGMVLVPGGVHIDPPKVIAEAVPLLKLQLVRYAAPSMSSAVSSMFTNSNLLASRMPPDSTVIAFVNCIWLSDNEPFACTEIGVSAQTASVVAWRQTL